MLGWTPHDRDTKFRKSHANVRDIETINKHLSDKGEQHLGADEKPVTADDIDINVPDENKPVFRGMLRKTDHMLSDQPGEKRITEMKIDLVPDTKPFKSPPYRAGFKRTEIECAEID